AGEVWISTIHQAKGREFDAVVIANLDRLLHPRGTNPEDCRLAYVAATRARRHVYRCAGSHWLPPMFDWDFESFDRASLSDPTRLGGEQAWHQAQEELWRAFRGLGRLRLHHAGGEEFGLEPEATGGKTVLRLAPAFTPRFVRFARERMHVDDP